MAPLHPSWLIALATFIGSPLAGGWLLAHNYQRQNQEQRGQKALYWGAAFAVLSGVLVFFTWNFLPVLLLPIFYASAYYIAAEVKFGDALKQQKQSKITGAFLPIFTGAACLFAFWFLLLQQNETSSYSVLEVGALRHQVHYENMTINEAGDIARALADAGHFGDEFQTYILCSKESETQLIYIPAFRKDWETATFKTYMETLKTGLTVNLGPNFKLYAIDEQGEETFTLLF